MSAGQVIKGALHTIKQNSPYILTAVCIGGNAAGTILAVKATPKAMEDIRQAEKAKGAALTPQEMMRAAGKNYIVPGVVILASDLCGILGIRKSERGKAAAISAAALAEKWGKEYQAKVVEHLGEGEERKLRDEMRQEQVHNALIANPPKPDWVPQIGTGTQLFYYVRHPQWFRSDVETIRSRVNDFNQMLLGSWNGVSEQEFETELGLEVDGSSEHFGWNPNRALPEVYFIFPSNGMVQFEPHTGYVSPWGEGAIGMDFRDGHEPYIGYDLGADIYVNGQ